MPGIIKTETRLVLCLFASCCDIAGVDSCLAVLCIGYNSIVVIVIVTAACKAAAQHLR